MTWDQIRELNNEKFVEIGNHSHTHEYLVEENKKTIIADIENSIRIFRNELGKNSNFFFLSFWRIQLRV